MEILRDQHFAVLSNYLEQEKMTKALTSSQDIIDCIRKRNYESNNETKLQRYTKRKFNHIWIEKLDHNMENNFSKTNFIRIDQLKTYYNLKYDENYGIVSSITSDFKEYMIVRDFQGNLPMLQYNKNYQRLIKETIADPKQEISLDNLKLKRMRMDMFKESILQRLKEGRGLDYTSILQNENGNSENVDDSIVENQVKLVEESELDIPLFCNNMCSNCKAFPKYKDMLINGVKPNQTEINHELGLHKHPKSRVYNKKLQSKFGIQRSADQGREELLNHYQFCH